jgi:hypothetical protein
LLEGLDIVAKILDALANGGFVIVFEVLEYGSPYRHLWGAVSGEARAKAEHALNVFIGELAIMALGESGEVGHAQVERGSGGAAAFGVGTVASGAVLLEHRFARGDVVGRELRFVRFGRGCRAADVWFFLSGDAEGEKQGAKKNGVADGHGLLLVGSQTIENRLARKGILPGSDQPRKL